MRLDGSPSTRKIARLVAQKNPMTRGLIDEIVLIDLVALLLSIATVSTVWYVVKKAFRADVGEPQFFLTFIAVIVPFVMFIYFGVAIINYDAAATSVGWPPALPLQGSLPPPIVGVVIFYIGQTIWLWLDWRKLWMPR
jgi:hypothetical protein